MIVTLCLRASTPAEIAPLYPPHIDAKGASSSARNNSGKLFGAVGRERGFLPVSVSTISVGLH